MLVAKPTEKEMLATNQVGTCPVTEAPNVKFVSYSGGASSLCIGTLVLKVCDKEYKWYSREIMHTGGCCGFCDDDFSEFTEEDEWLVYYYAIPDEIRKFAAEIDWVINQNIPFGCCGGCL